MRYKKLNKKSIPKKNLHNKSKSKVVGSKRKIINVQDKLEFQYSKDFITFDKVSTVEDVLSNKKSRLYNFNLKTITT